MDKLHYLVFMYKILNNEIDKETAYRTDTLGEHTLPISKEDKDYLFDIIQGGYHD